MGAALLITYTLRASKTSILISFFYLSHGSNVENSMAIWEKGRGRKGGDNLARKGREGYYGRSERHVQGFQTVVRADKYMAARKSWNFLGL